MEIKITSCSRGGFTVDIGKPHSGGVKVDYKPGVTMPAFIVYESAHLETLEQAKRYAHSKALQYGCDVVQL